MYIDYWMLDLEGEVHSIHVLWTSKNARAILIMKFRARHAIVAS